jgi:hypothetical protein
MPAPSASRPPGPDYPAGWLTRFRRGFVSGVTMLIVAVVLLAIPTLLAWFAPGADSTSAGAALRAAVLLTIAGNHGGFRLDGTAVTLTPLLVTLLLAWLVGANARRPDSTSGFVGFATGYVVATALLARWSHIGQTGLAVFPSALAALVFVLVIGLGARTGPRLWRQAEARWRRVGRAAVAVVTLYFLLGAALSAVLLGAHLHAATLVQARLATGAAGLPVTLIGIGAAPNAVLGAIGYLTGPGFSVGAHTSVSAFAVQRGQLPAFPMLAALPSHRGSSALGLALIACSVLLAGWAALRVLKAASPIEPGAAEERWATRPTRDRLVDLLCSGLLAAALLAVLTTLAGGSLGPGSLHHIGPSGWLVGLAVLAETLIAGLGWLGVTVLFAALRDRGQAPAAAPSTAPAKAAPAPEAAQNLAVLTGGKPAEADQAPARDLRSAG